MSITLTEPILERITSELFDRLQLLVVGTDEWKATEVIRPKRLAEYTPQHRQILLLLGEEEEPEDQLRPGNPPAITKIQTYLIVCNLMPSELDPTPIETYEARVVAQVVIAVTQAGTQWHNFNGLAINSEFGASQAIEASGGVAGVVVPLKVTYRTSEWNPYEARV